MALRATVHWTPLCEAGLQSMHRFLLAPPFDDEPHILKQLSCVQLQMLTDRFDQYISVACPS